ncbi:MAG TPA: serine hydrolase domain-containing protein [Kineosporiaceae bacterium]|nr:serine hydrolase domain-containing protein [Kineosporiaceae bacterium]
MSSPISGPSAAPGRTRTARATAAVLPEAPALAAVDAEAARFQADGGQPGIAYGVVAGGALVHSGGLGERRAGGGTPPDAGTGFRIASMTKCFTAAVILQLRDEGVLRLDDPVSAHVPEARGLRGPTADSPAITVRDLLTMAGGFPTDDPWGDRQQGLPGERFAALVRGGLSFAWAPGTAFEYSNLGYALLGRVIETCTGAAYRDVVTARLLTPLGMSCTGFDAAVLPARELATGHRVGDGGWQPVPYDPYGAFAPMGGLFSTVADLARWIGEYTDAFPPRDDPEGGHPLCRASRREQQQAHRGIPPQLIWPSVDAVPTVRFTGYGYGLVVEHDPAHGLVVGHSGGYPGFGSHMRWHPRTGLGVVVLGNATYSAAQRPAARMLSALLSTAGRTARRARRSAGPSIAVRAGASPVQPPPSGQELWEATAAARRAVEGLLIQGWDDAVAADLFAENVDLDLPLVRRRAELERLRQRLGPLTADPAAPVDRSSPAQCAWWMRGPGGRVRVAIMLSPQSPPRIQTLQLTLAAEPVPVLRRVAELVVAQLAEPCPQWPQALATGVDLDRTALDRTLRVAAAWAGACDLVAVTAGDGLGQATFRLAGERADLSLTLTVDPPAGPPTGDDALPVVRRFGLAVEL